ncbi:hypothetical protein SRHO_G00109950 [Serrasalmus rhombeus]
MLKCAEWCLVATLEIDFLALCLVATLEIDFLALLTAVMAIVTRSDSAHCAAQKSTFMIWLKQIICSGSKI